MISQITEAREPMYLDKIRSFFFLAIKNKFTPTIISISIGVIFNHFRQQDVQNYIQKLQDKTDELKVKVDWMEARDRGNVEREKAKVAVYENHCALFEKKVGYSCTGGTND